MNRTLILLFLLLQSLTGPVVQPELHKRVSEYWDLLVKRDKAAALAYVTPDARNDFIRRQEPLMRSWKLKSIDLVSNDQAQVSVEIERVSNSGTPYGFSTVTENWVRREGVWMASVAMPDQAEVMKALTGSNQQNKEAEIPLTGQVRIVPHILKIWFLSRKSQGMVRIQNEKAAPIEIESVDYDESRFKLLQVPGEIQPRSRAPLRVEFTGDEIKKNLSSEMVLHYRVLGQVESLKIEVVYNAFSDASRGLFGLTKEEADKLPRGVVPKPVIKAPKPDHPPQNPPVKPPPG